MSETLIYLVRHGATAANVARPYVLQGSNADHPLSEQGRGQAAAVGSFLANLSIDGVYSSRLKRSIETAEAIARHHGCSVETVDGIHEVDVGTWEGMPWQQVMDESPDHYRAFMDDVWNVPYLGGESYQDVLDRAKPAMVDLARRNIGKSIVVVAHQVVNRAILADVLNIERGHARGIRQANTGINVLRWRPGETEVITLNGCFHLSAARV